MFLSKFVEDVSGIEARIVSNLSGDDFQGLGKGVDDELLFSVDVSGVLSEVFADFHFSSATSRNDVAVLSSSSDDHNGVVDGSLRFIDELLAASSKDDRC